MVSRCPTSTVPLGPMHLRPTFSSPRLYNRPVVPSAPPNPKQLVLVATPPPFIRWPLLKGHMQLSRGHCLGNKGQLLSHDLTKGDCSCEQIQCFANVFQTLFLANPVFFLNTVTPSLWSSQLVTQNVLRVPIKISHHPHRKVSISRKGKKFSLHQVPKMTICFENRF